MRVSVAASAFERLGLPPDGAEVLAARVSEALGRHRDRHKAEQQVRLWRELQRLVVSDPAWRWNFDVHLALYHLAFEGRRREDGPPPAWVPSPEDASESNIGRLMAERGARSYEDLHRWSVENREEFWSTIIRKLGIVFREEPDHILVPGFDSTCPDWLPGAQMNIAESCFRADPDRVAIWYASEDAPNVRRVTYGELRRLCNRVADSLDALGLARGERVALYLPMTPESVAIYLGVVLAGRCVVGIADTSAPRELERRVRLGGAKAVFTVDAYSREGKDLRIYAKVVEADAPKAVVLPREGEADVTLARSEDLAWEDFLSDHEAFDVARCRPSDYTNILFSSGTTKDPKVIPWTHTTPIKSAADAYLHHDMRETDVLAWPTSFGWMMGPWLTYASLVNRASMALYVGATQRREFGKFIQEVGVTMLGIVPKLVRAWKTERTMEGLDWSRVRLFSSTAEPSTPDEMLYLMSLAGYRPIIEYCGGTEIGGGYITGTVVQPCAPSTFTTPAMGLDFVIYDEGKPAPRGEVFLIPPSIGLSWELLNYDHYHEYFEGVPRGPNGEVLRRHGDQIERLGGGYYRHHGRIDDMININGVKTSGEEIRSVIWHDSVYDVKPVAVDVDRSGQHRLIIYAVPRDRRLVESSEERERLRREFQRSIKEKLNPLLAHVHDVVLVSELPQAGPGKTRTMKDLQRDYLARRKRRANR